MICKNEPILFGAPIILNPIMFIPHVFGGAIIGTLPVFLMHWGLLDKPIFDPPYVGVFLEGFLTNGDWRTILANGLQLVLAIALYWPFFKVMERQEEEAEAKKAEEATKDIFSSEDKDLLGDLDLGNLGAKGLFTGMIAGLLAVELYNFCKVKNLTIKMPEGVPDFVSKSFELIPTSLIVGGTFIVARFASLAIFGELPPQILTKFLAPLVGSMDNPWAVLGLNFAICTIFFFGIHSSVFSPITRPIMVTFIAENIAAMQAGQPIPHFYTAGTSSAFFGFTGCGISIGCVIACLLSKNKRYKQIGKVSLFPALFGINEPILFGAPIILNPIMFIPHVFGGAIIGTLPMFLMHWGLLDKPIFDPPYVGVFLEGFLTNGDWRTILVNALQLVLSVALYWPFFKIMERQEEAEEAKKVEETKDIFSSEDKDLLGDLDLDF